jgi:hypothetical protein
MVRREGFESKGSWSSAIKHSMKLTENMKNLSQESWYPDKFDTMSPKYKTGAFLLHQTA